MANLTAKQSSAIAWYVSENNVRPMATNAFPNYEFRNKDTQEIESINIASLTDAYDAREKNKKRKSKQDDKGL